MLGLCLFSAVSAKPLQRPLQDVSNAQLKLFRLAAQHLKIPFVFAFYVDVLKI